MSNYYDELRIFLAKNNRSFRCTDAGPSYWDMVNHGISEPLAYKTASLLDKLQFTAYEMWIGSYFLKSQNFTETEVDYFVAKLPAGIEKFSYYSDDLTSFLISLHDEIRQKPLNERGSLEDHIYQSLSKELYTYRSGHKLVQQKK